MELDNIRKLCYIFGSLERSCRDLWRWIRVEDVHQEVPVLDAHHRSWLKGDSGLRIKGVRCTRGGANIMDRGLAGRQWRLFSADTDIECEVKSVDTCGCVESNVICNIPCSNVNLCINRLSKYENPVSIMFGVSPVCALQRVVHTESAA